MIFFIFFILGLFVGSFLNVVILRLKKGQGGILVGRSKCPQCKKTLKWFDLVPLLSFLFLKGRCHYCQKPISVQYPLVEFFTGLLFALLYWKFGLSWQFGLLAVVSSLLAILFVYDLKTQTIPDLIVYLGIGLVVIYLLAYSSIHLFIYSSIVAAAISSGFFALLVLISRETWMGKGDIKLGILMGLILGYPNILVGLFLSFVLGALVGLLLILLKKKTLKSQIPFGPFLISAIFITIFFGEGILKWYLSLLL